MFNLRPASMTHASNDMARTERPRGLTVGAYGRGVSRARTSQHVPVALGREEKGSRIATMVFAALLVLSSSKSSQLSAPDTRRGRAARMTGSVACHEPVALPAGAVLRVTLLDLGRPEPPGAVVADEAIRAEGPLPIRFVLEFDPGVIQPRHSYGVSARITDAGGRLLWATEDAYPVTMGKLGNVELTVRRADRISPSSTKAARTLTVDCEGLSFTVRIEGDTARLFLPDRTLVLDRVRDAAGTKYGGGASMLRIEGDAASLLLNGKLYRTCELKTP